MGTNKCTSITNIEAVDSTNNIDASCYNTSIKVDNYITNIEEIGKALSTNEFSYLIV